MTDYILNYAVQTIGNPKFFLLILQIGERSISYNYPTDLHKHTNEEIFYISEGTVQARIYGKIHNLGKGTILFLSPGTKHFLYTKSPAHTFFMNYAITMRQDPSHSVQHHAPSNMKNLILTSSIIGRCEKKNINTLFLKAIDAGKSENKNNFIVVTRKLCQELNAVAKNGIILKDGGKFNTDDVGTAMSFKGIRLMKKNLFCGITVEKLCSNHLFVSTRHFRRIFHRTTGLSPHEYLLNLKMDAARKLLKKGLPPKAIAVQLGYKEISSFYRAFSIHTGSNLTCFTGKSSGRK